MAKKGVTHTATRDTVLRPEEVFAVAADLELLPQWWFDDSPGELIVLSERVVRGDTLRAAPGVVFEVVSGRGTTNLFGRVWTSEKPSVIVFRCELATPASALRFVHRPVSGNYMKAKISTELEMEALASGARIRLSQEMRVDGVGLGKAIQRAVIRRSQFVVEKALGRLIDIAETQ
jgi:hypothetical protein